ncbi:MAG: hypothetical protein AABZ17_14655 [Nitrospirota bacterium]|jgi:hypothetical protein
MRTYAAFVILLALVVQWGCSRTILVPVPPRMDLKSYGTLGIIEFASNSDPAISNYATQQFQEHVQGAYPGTPILELGNREAVLAAVGATQFDADAIAKIGKKYGVTAVFLGDIVYSEPKTDIRLTDINKLEGGVRTEVRGDMSTKLMETQSGASVWSSSAWAKRQIGSVSLSTKRGVSATVGDSNPRKDMVPALILHLTQDFRPKLVRQRAP